MRKISIILAALTLIVGSASCGSRTTEEDLSSEFIAAYEEYEDAKNESSFEKTEIIELDPFENITFSTVSTLAYPREMTIELDGSQSDADSIYQNRGYTLNITEAGIDAVKFNVAINEDVVEGLKEEENIIVSPTEKDFEIPIENCPMHLISEDQLTDDIKNKLIELIKEQIIEKITSENSDYKADIRDDITLVGCYMSDVKKDADFIKDYNYTANERQIVTNFEADDFYFVAIFKNSDDQYFTGDCQPEFYNGQLSDDSLDVAVRNCSTDINPFTNNPFSAEHKCFPSVESIISGYEEGQNLILPLNLPLREVK